MSSEDEKTAEKKETDDLPALRSLMIDDSVQNQPGEYYSQRIQILRQLYLSKKCLPKNDVLHGIFAPRMKQIGPIVRIEY